MTTIEIIKSLRDIQSSEFNKMEALFTLTKHNDFKPIKDSLIQCYINEDIEEAIKLVNIHIDMAHLPIKQGRTIYTLTKNSIAKQKADSRGTLGYQMQTIGGDEEWLRAMDILEYLQAKKEMLRNKDFIKRYQDFKSQLKRKARLQANSHYIKNKQGATTKYKKREVPIPPSKRAEA